MDHYARRAEEYRNKAEEVRTVAGSMSNSEAKQLMLEVAEDYVRMAQTLDRLACASKSKH